MPSENTSGTKYMGGIILPPNGPPLPQSPSVPIVKPTASDAADSIKHEAEKTALIIGSIAAGL